MTWEKQTIDMMMSNDPTVIRNIATYIYKSFDLRENVVNS